LRLLALEEKGATAAGSMCSMRVTPALLLTTVALSCAREAETFLVFGETMGTTWQLSLRADADGRAAYHLVQEQVDLVEGLMSPWVSESDLSRFAQAEADVLVPVSKETMEVVLLARATWQETGGAFDPTIGALVEASGFGVAEATQDESSRRAAMEYVGFNAIEVDVQTRTLKKARAGVRLDLSAVAKGYAVDRAAAALSDAGYEDFFLEVGGEIFAKGGNGERDDWVVGIEAPSEDPLAPRRVFTSLYVTGVGVATSGDYRNLRELNGELQSHLFDPRTGEPVSRELGSVTVIAPNCATADAYATAAMVMGLERGMEWLESVSAVEAVFISRSAEGDLSKHQTSGAEALLREGS
jgi:thiamine biosynthesis lipoprotein